jgi:zinc and cadmium transporter
MGDAAVPALLSVLAVSCLSFAGAVVLALGEVRLRRVLHGLVALAAGALLGDAVLHLLPEATEIHGGFTPTVAWLVLGGLLGFFGIEQALHWHHHGEDLAAHERHVHRLAWMNLLGDFLHNLIDGMLIAGTWMVSPEAGLATTVAVALHEIPQEMGDFGVLVHAGLTPKRALLWNFGSALAAVLGAAVVLLAPGDLRLETWITPIAAGGFLYVACADLVPELRTRGSRRVLVGTALALAAGVLAIALVGQVAGHSHAVPEHDHHPGHRHD